MAYALEIALNIASPHVSGGEGVDRRPMEAGVLAAALVGWWACFDSLRRMTLLTLPGFAAKYVVGAVVAAASVAGLLHWAIARSTGKRTSSLTSTMVSAALTGVWLPPLALFLRHSSPWLLAPLFGASVSLAAIIATYRCTGIGADSPVPDNGAPAAMRESLAASVLFQLTLALVIANEPVWAMPTLSGGGALLTLMFLRARPELLPDIFRPRTAARLLAIAFAAAWLLTACSLSWHLPRVRPMPGGGEEQTPLAPPNSSANAAAVWDVSDVRTGVIIWPEKEQVIRLLPPMPSLAPGFGRSHMDNPLSIPFYGAYWIYRPPDRQPPPDSLVIRGNPADRHIRSTDHLPMRMEARQNFGAYLSPQCCASIDLDIINTDSFRGTLSLELLLGDSSAGGKGLLSLGRVQVPSASFQPPGSARRSQRLNFAMPSAAQLPRFDEAMIVFHLDRMRADVAARVGIERFVLNPRGR